MAGKTAGQENIRDALPNIARQANQILRYYRYVENINSVERTIASDIGTGHVNELTTEFESHAQTNQNVSSRSTSSSSLTSQGQRQSFSESSTTNQQNVHSALHCAFPTFGNAKGVFKSARNKHDHNSSSKAKGI